jgi:hypothetical protein
MITITKRGAQMGRINNRLQKHGEEEVTAFDIPLDSIAIDANELNAILADPGAHHRMFHKAPDGGITQPSFDGLKPFELKDKFEDVAADLFLGMAEDVVTVTGASLASVTLTPQPGGLTFLSAKLQFVPDLKTAPLLLQFQGHEVSVELREGKKAEASAAQESLPLSTAAAA